MIYPLIPLIPLFLTQTLGAPTAVLGVIEGAAGGSASLPLQPELPRAFRHRIHSRGPRRGDTVCGA
jgi:hypothetical protein